MPWKEWKEASKGAWGTEVSEGGYLGNERIQIGCLQRIADTLETIAKRLDPRWRKVREKEMEEEHDRDKIKDAWLALISWEYEKVLDDKIRRHFRPWNPTKEERTAVAKLSWRVFGWIRGDDWGGPGNGWTAMPEPTRKAEIEARKASFDPATFDWSLIELTPLMRGRLNGLLARSKETVT